MIASAEQFRGQERLRSLLGRYVDRKRMAGTLLLLGQRGLGKTTLSSLIVRALCCQAQGRSGLEFCGECYACKSISQGEQSEFVTVRPKGQDIKVEQIEEELEGLRSASLHPLHLPYRIFLFDDAHCLNPKTSNQLLKLLEEPPARSIFILITDQPDRLLPTIRSRGVPFALSALPRWQLEQFLQEDRPDSTARQLREAAYLAGGRYVDALALAMDDAWRQACTELAAAMTKQRDVIECAARLQGFEFAALWDKQLRDSGLSEDEAQKQIEKQRINELKRQALCLAYDRGAWQLLHEAGRGLDTHEGPERRRAALGMPGQRLASGLALLKQRINANVDPPLAQAAFEAVGW